jgi:tetratricopeptide (TPR) repeat protein
MASLVTSLEARRRWPAPVAAFQAVLLAGLVCAVYAPYLTNAFVFDDLVLFNGQTIYEFAAEFWRTQVRWLSYATLAHTHMLSDGSIVALRLGNLLLHAASSIAVFVLLRDLLGAASDRGIKAVSESSQGSRLALLGAALFAVHPVAVYGVGYLVQRSIIMATLFMLLMLISYLRWLNNGRSALWIASAIWFLLSVFSKEHSVVAPAAALLLTLVLRRPSLGLARRLAPPYIAYAVIVIMVTLVAKGVLGTTYEVYAVDMLAQSHGVDAGRSMRDVYTLSVITQAWLFFKYLFLWMVPNPAWMSMDMREPVAASLLTWPYWAAAIAFICYPVLAIRMALKGGRAGVAGWALAFPWLMFIPELSTVRVQEPFVLYRAYLWFPVFSVIVPLAIERLSLRAATLSVTVIVCAFVPLSWNRLASLSEPLVAWEDAAKLLVRGNEPGAGRIYYNRALALAEKNRLDEALADMDKTVALHPGLAPVRLARAKILFNMKRYAEALDAMNVAIGLDSKRSDFYVTRAVVLKRLGRDYDAVQDMRRSCKLGQFMACALLDKEGAGR